MTLAWTLLQAAGTAPEDFAWTALAISLAYLALPRTAPAPNKWIAWPLILLLAWIAFQLVPLPASVMRILSPARAALTDGTPFMGELAPLAVMPAAALREALRIGTCVLMFLTVRELAWHWQDRPWLTAGPMVAIAALQAALGLVQFYIGRGVAAQASQAVVARGTYVNRDHFAGLMEMALPFAVVFGLAAWRRGDSRFRTPLKPALFACCAIALAALLLLGAMHSLSRMGWMCALLAIALSLRPTRPRAGFAGRALWLAPLAFAALLFLYLPSDALIQRFGLLTGEQDRPQLWRESLPLLAAYPITGTGLGGYESAFLKYKISWPHMLDDYAHNDYLQYAIELGAIGFAALAAFVLALLWQAGRAGTPLGAAALASLLAILAHEFVDFNLYIPGNALVFAWVAGLASAARFVRRTPERSYGADDPARHARSATPEVIDIRAVKA